ISWRWARRSAARRRSTNSWAGPSSRSSSWANGGSSSSWPPTSRGAFASSPSSSCRGAAGRSRSPPWPHSSRSSPGSHSHSHVEGYSSIMKTIFRIIATTLALSLASGLAAAQAFPSKPVKIIVPFVAGGATDVVARLLAQKLTEAWGQSVVVENRAGAGGNIGADVVAKAAPDGYTLLMTSGSIVTANPYMYKSMTFDAAKDLVGITNVATGPQVIAISAD